jgi:spore maturation protein CgeB
MKILLLSPDQLGRYNWGHQLFRNEIGKHHDVIYYGDGYKGYNKRSVADVIKQYDDVDIILTYGYRYTLPFGNFKVPTHIKRVHIVIDLFPPHPGGYKGSFSQYRPFISDTTFDLFFVRQRVQREYLKQLGCTIPSEWLPFSVDTNIYKKKDLAKGYDVITSSTNRADVYPNRIPVKQLVKSMNLKAVTGRVTHGEYVRYINESKIAIISTNVFNSPNMKFTEFTSCGTFVLADKPQDFDELGFKDGEHLVLYKDISDLKDKIKYYLKHDEEREEIAINGMNFVRKKHNNVIRVKQFVSGVKLGGVS